MPSRVFSLNVHAGWQCRHSGACCTAGWSIPVEAHARWITGTDWLEPDARGACPHFDGSSSLCRIHRDHGEAMIPESCRHFPRRSLTDARGTFVALSHYCPTAAALLVDGERLSIVESPPAFPAGRAYDGLDATGEWPPLLRANALFDHDSFSAWEQYLVDTLGSTSDDVHTTLTRVAGAAEQLRTWSSSSGDLRTWSETALRHDRAEPHAAERYAPVRGRDAFDRVCGCVPPGLRRPEKPRAMSAEERPRFDAAWRRQSRVILRYIGARAFASWTAYQSTGVRTQVAELFATAEVLRAECTRQWLRSGVLDRAALVDAIRASDWLLVHLADRTALMDWLGQVER